MADCVVLLKSQHFYKGLRSLNMIVFPLARPYYFQTLSHITLPSFFLLQPLPSPCCSFNITGKVNTQVLGACCFLLDSLAPELLLLPLVSARISYYYQIFPANLIRNNFTCTNTHTYRHIHTPAQLHNTTTIRIRISIPLNGFIIFCSTQHHPTYYKIYLFSFHQLSPPSRMSTYYGRDFAFIFLHSQYLEQCCI